MNEKEKIYEHIDKNFDEHLERVRKNLRIPGVSLTEPLYTNKEVIRSAEDLLNYIKDLDPAEAELAETDGYPVVYGKVKSKNPDANTVILYSLYDLMPADEPDWKSPPFAAEILNAEEIGLPPFYGKCIVSRGARNQRGPNMGFINALKSMKEVTGDIPAHVIFAIEGEEELGSPHVSQFRDRYQDKLRKADGCFYPNPSTDYHGRHHVILGYRGIMNIELRVRGGDWGGPAERSLFSSEDHMVDAPAWRLLWALNTLRGTDGKILIEGFYDDVRPWTDEEREMVEELKKRFNEEDYKRERGVRRLKGGLPGIKLYESYLMDPRLNINGYSSGYTGPAVKTSFPDRAVVKLDIRLVPNMKVDDIRKKLRRHLDKHGFTEVEIHEGGCYSWVRTSIKADVVQAALRAAEKHGVESICHPLYFGSTPSVVFGGPPLNIPCVSAGLGRMGRPHEANEYITVEGLREFEKYVVTFLYEFAEAKLTRT
jgi:acetylornithine deacetylase/succinyl-diaminopimelate desuccinylase-like protein